MDQVLSETVDLDETDHEIIRMLIKDGRVSNREIGQKIGMTDATVAARLRRLVAERCIAVCPLYDWRAAGFRCEAYIFIKVLGRPPAAVAAKLANDPFVNSAIITTGAADILIFALAPDEEGLHQLLAKIVSEPGVADMRVDKVVETHLYRQNLSRLPYVPFDPEKFPKANIELDMLDIQILSSLQHDGRLSSREIARQLNCGDAKVRIRIKRMEESGLLRMGAIVDPFRTGISGSAAFVGITSFGEPQRVVKALSKMAPVNFCATCIGEHTIISVMGFHDDDSLNTATTEDLWSIKGVAGVTAYRLVDFKKITTDLIRIV